MKVGNKKEREGERGRQGTGRRGRVRETDRREGETEMEGGERGERRSDDREGSKEWGESKRASGNSNPDLENCVRN